MSKHDLLAHLPAYPTNPKALALAKQCLSDESVVKLTCSLRAREKTISRLDAVLTLLTGLLTVAFFAMAGGWAVASGQGILCCLVLLVLGIGLRCYWGLPLSLLQQLEPLAGTDLCEKALELVRSGAPNVAAWRNIALTERNQLYVFDYNVMYLLWSQHFQAVREVDRKETLDKACRALHQVS